MATLVNTATGQIYSDDLGKTLVHEHFALGSPGFQGDTLGPYDPRAIVKTGIEVAEKAKAHGVETIVDATPNEYGRDAEVLREISERAEIQIICSTGYYLEGEDAPAYFAFHQGLGSAPAEVEELMLTEIIDGIGDTGVKAGVVKLASSKDEITDYGQMFFAAGAKAQRETGVPTITHTQEGTMAPEQAEFLLSEGADPDRVMIGHMDGNTDQAYHIGTLSHAVNIAFDRYGIQGLVGMPMDELRTACLLGLLGTGYGDRIMLSHDTANVWLGRPPVLPEEAEELLANWHITYLFDNVLPVLEEAGVTDEQLDGIFFENPKRLFGS